MNVQLSKREIQLLLRLLEINGSITTKKLAEEFKVSVRTIKYDLENLRFWLKERGIALLSQRSKGIWFDLTETQRIGLKNELFVSEQFEPHLDQELRVSRILMQLLMAREFLTTGQLAELLKVSKNTVTADLERVDEFLQAFPVHLLRQSGHGLKLEGKEEDLRFLMEYLLHLELTEYDIYTIMMQLTGKDEGTKASLAIGKGTDFHEIYPLVLEELGKLLKPSTLDDMNYTELLGLTFRMAIAAGRLRQQHAIGGFQMLDLTAFNERPSIPLQLMTAVFADYELPIFSAEYEYILSDAVPTDQQEDTLTLTKALIKKVSRELGIPFDQDHELLMNLFTHLSLRLSRKHQYYNEYNPFVDDIREMHPKLFDAIRKVCRDEMPAEHYMVNDSFVAYIALHFLVCFEREKQNSATVKVVYVCSTGLGVTSLIQQRVAEEVPEIEIVNFASVLNANELINEAKPDLVISIFPIEHLVYPLIKVNAIPSKDDLAAIKEFVAKRQAQEPQSSSAFYRKPVLAGKENAENLSREVILKGYVVYEGIKKIFAKELKESYEEAFLLHVLMMVYRIMFDHQYTLEGKHDNDLFFDNKEMMIKVEQLFSENDLSVNEAELSALCQYLRFSEVEAETNE